MGVYIIPSGYRNEREELRSWYSKVKGWSC